MQNVRYRSINKVLWIILFANFLIAAVKIGVGIVSKSQSVIADGIHSVADGSSNIVGLIGIWLASKPRDEKHPYGHEKFEILASLFIGLMLLVMSVRIMSRAFLSFSEPTALIIESTQIWLILITIAVNIIIAGTEYRCGKKLQSTILVTDSLHTRGDVFISCAVLLGFIGINAGLPVWVDGALSLMVAVAVFISALQIIKNCADVLVDSTAVDSDEVKKLIVTIPGIYDVHKVRSRGEPTHAFIDFHVIVSPQESVECMHALSHKLEAIIKEHFGPNTEVSIHMEPNDGLHDN